MSAAVKEIKWQENTVTAITTDGQEYTAAKIILTIPIGVWQANDVSKGTIQFTPALADHMAAFGKMGMGAIIKFLLQFKTPFWAEKDMQEHTGKDMEDMLFLFSDQKVPTWWSLYPVESALLTGWLGGPKAAALQGMTDEALLEMALTSLAGIFSVPAASLKEQLGAWHVANWTSIPYTCGSYSYVTTETAEALKLLQAPVLNTIYFSGEGMYEGSAIGTVEAALVSGKETAENIINTNPAN